MCFAYLYYFVGVDGILGCSHARGFNREFMYQGLAIRCGVTFENLIKDASLAKGK